MSEQTIQQVGNLYPWTKFKNCHRGRVYSPRGLCPSLDCKGGGQREKKILIVCEQELSSR